MAIKAWLHCVGSGKKWIENDLVSYLTNNSIDVLGFEPYMSQGYGILLFDEFNQEVCDFLREASFICRERVLAGFLGNILPEHCLKLVHAGAADVFNCADCQQAANEITARLSRWEVIDQLLCSPRVESTLVGNSPMWKSILRQVIEVAYFSEASVLILGDSGTGKELIARLIHDLDNRSDKRELVTLDCSTIMPELSGSEFFGHERGAFTGAVSSRDGAFALADRGTLFLDEVGELPLHLQTQLLRVIQEQTFKRVGGNAWQHTAFRLICATNRDLWAQVQRGEFRADLYFRIASFICRLPPLSERPEDIIPLVTHFLKELHHSPAPPETDALVQDYLKKREYPGNIRDLKQVVARMLCRHAGEGPLTVGCIPPEDRLYWFERTDDCDDSGFDMTIRQALLQGVGLKGISRMAEETAIRIAMGEAQGNLQQAALRLGVTDRTLQMRRAARRQEE